MNNTTKYRCKDVSKSGREVPYTAAPCTRAPTAPRLSEVNEWMNERLTLTPARSACGVRVCLCDMLSSPPRSRMGTRMRYPAIRATTQVPAGNAHPGSASGGTGRASAG